MSHPSCRREAGRAPPRAARPRPPDCRCGSSSPRGRWRSGARRRSRAASRRQAASAGVTRRHGTPSARQLPAKISPKLSPITAVMPQRRNACGACSREEPQPKFFSTSSRLAARRVGSSKGCGSALSRRALRSSAKTCCSSPAKLTALRKRPGMMRSVSMSLPRSDTAVPAICRRAGGVAGGAAMVFALTRGRQTGRAGRSRRRRWRRPPPSPATSTGCGRSVIPAAP